MLVSVDETEMWETVIGSVSKDHVPVQCIKKVQFKFKGGKQKTINLARLRKEGLDIEEIETVLTRTMVENSDNIITMDFVVDIEEIKAKVQPITDKILANL